MKPELIIFDWDGTLMDSAARIVACMTLAFQDVAQPPPTPAAIRDVIGLGLEEAMLVLWPTADPELRTQVAEHYRARFLTPDSIPTPLFPHVARVIEELYAGGWLLAVATGKSRRGLNKVLIESQLGHYFHATRCADETRSKPHPQMLFELLDELGATPQSALMIGDTVFDLEMANQAGVRALAVDYGVHSRERLLTQSPCGCLSSLAELPQWLVTLG
ncbi:HAD-IA family hydrolase [Thiospirillum jenense]|uniref:HAD-IA family hydrolase n=2 Tax=Thiospirillum jenense TaxID=1653858 RepID=A0A839HCN2_9GAMM|nr:HAD-IA family hydrolase [Thiospirillum jenense]MBB1125176.1 HAD-IA family hydrolase [Thiospirillum jenense]